MRYVPALKRHPRVGWNCPIRSGTVWGPPWVKVREAVDEDMYDGLAKFAAQLGIDHKRLPKMRGRMWGYSVRGESRIRTRLAARSRSSFTRSGTPSMTATAWARCW